VPSAVPPPRDIKLSDTTIPNSSSDEEDIEIETQAYIPLDFSPTATAPPTPFEPVVEVTTDSPTKRSPDAGTIWGLLVLSLAYLHHSTSGFALPALLPIISEDLHLADSQGALLTAGYTVLYALALVPMGLLADRVDRPRLLAVGIALWSGLTVAAASSTGFTELLIARVGFAAAQATQNPICFSLIPELFPNGRTTAMAVYNSAIYAGRALSFTALIVAGKLGVPQGIIGTSIDIAYTLVPLDKVDLSLVSVLYTQGDFAAVTPIYTYASDAIEGAMQMESAFSAWRQLLTWLGPPGLIIAVIILLTVDEPRQGRAFLGDPIKSSRFLSGLNASKKTSSGSSSGGGTSGGNGSTALAVAADPPSPPVTATISESIDKVKELLKSPAFVALTAAAAFNDVGSWALVAWQATFYQRVYELTPDTYAPLLAIVIPVGGLIGGVGAGLFGDTLNRIGARGWITAGANIAAAPMIAASLLAPDYKQSFAALLVGFALSEAWRAPAAVAVRDISPPGLGSTGSAVHLCIRNLVGGLGPIAVAFLATKVGLQVAMLLVPSCYLLSGVSFIATEAVIASENAKQRI
jgi:MFS family permease